MIVLLLILLLSVLVWVISHQFLTALFFGSTLLFAFLFFIVYQMLISTLRYMKNKGCELPEKGYWKKDIASHLMDVFNLR